MTVDQSSDGLMRNTDGTNMSRAGVYTCRHHDMEKGGHPCAIPCPVAWGAAERGCPMFDGYGSVSVHTAGNRPSSHQGHGRSSHQHHQQTPHVVAIWKQIRPTQRSPNDAKFKFTTCEVFGFFLKTKKLMKTSEAASATVDVRPCHVGRVGQGVAVKL
jgi:hypothetical protein